MLIAGVLAVLLACMAAGATLVVDGDGGTDFTSIQAAVDAASAGDTTRGAERGDARECGVDKQLTLDGEGADVETVQAVNLKGCVFRDGR
jgi:pectin methylesterase-like acyl-CoA thioesterase